MTTCKRCKTSNYNSVWIKWLSSEYPPQLSLWWNWIFIEKADLQLYLKLGANASHLRWKRELCFKIPSVFLNISNMWCIVILHPMHLSTGIWLNVQIKSDLDRVVRTGFGGGGGSTSDSAPDSELLSFSPFFFLFFFLLLCFLCFLFFLCGGSLVSLEIISSFAGASSSAVYGSKSLVSFGLKKRNHMEQVNSSDYHLGKSHRLLNYLIIPVTLKMLEYTLPNSLKCVNYCTVRWSHLKGSKVVEVCHHKPVGIFTAHSIVCCCQWRTPPALNTGKPKRHRKLNIDLWK